MDDSPARPDMIGLEAAGEQQSYCKSQSATKAGRTGIMQRDARDAQTAPRLVKTVRPRRSLSENFQRGRARGVAARNVAIFLIRPDRGALAFTFDLAATVRTGDARFGVISRLRSTFKCRDKSLGFTNNHTDVYN